jgi:hypothetical protein
MQGQGDLHLSQRDRLRGLQIEFLERLLRPYLILEHAVIFEVLTKAISSQSYKQPQPIAK